MMIAAGEDIVRDGHGIDQAGIIVEEHGQVPSESVRRLAADARLVGDQLFGEQIAVPEEPRGKWARPVATGRAERCGVFLADGRRADGTRAEAHIEYSLVGVSKSRIVGSHSKPV